MSDSSTTPWTPPTANAQAARPNTAQPKIIPMMTLEDAEKIISRMPKHTLSEASALIQRNLGRAPISPLSVNGK